MEHAWDALGRAIDNRLVYSLKFASAANALREEWDAIRVDLISKLVDSMPRRVHGLVRARGGHTRC